MLPHIIRRTTNWTAIGILLTLSAVIVRAEGHSYIDPTGISGTIVAVGGGRVPQSAIKAFAAAVPEGASVVVISTASASPQETADSAIQWLNENGVANKISSSWIELSSDNNGDEHRKQLSELLKTAGGVWICGGQQSRLGAAYADTDVELEIRNVLQRGGVVGGTSAGAAIMSKVMIESGNDEPTISRGFDLIPDAVIDQHFSQRERVVRSRRAISLNPARFGLGIDEDTAVIVRGRTVSVVGPGSVTCLLAASDVRPAEEVRLSAGQIADLIQLRRAAQSRSSGIDPGLPQYGLPRVASGALVIVGGGLPDQIVDRFIELAGGEQAHIVVLPTAVPRREARRAEIPDFLQRADVASVTILPQVGPDEVGEPDFQLAMQKATGIWFGGGRQWNFIDAYDGTNAVALFQDVLRRGGVIGGSSAGATIQGEFLVRGHPLGNMVMMAEGYERGFAFLPGVAIDQHFSNRNRQPDLVTVIQRHPKMLGIGIDEATAIVVKDTSVEVIGKAAAHFLTGQDADLGNYISVKSGEHIDLANLKHGENESPN